MFSCARGREWSGTWQERRGGGLREAGRAGGQCTGAAEAGQQAAGAGQARRAGCGSPSIRFHPHRHSGSSQKNGSWGPGNSGRRRLWVEDFPLLLAGCQALPHPTVGLPRAPTGERLGRSAPSHIPFFTFLLDNWPGPRGTEAVGLGGEEGGTQTDAHTGKEGAEAGLLTEGPQGSHWGRALRMAFTSSATAVRANSNWSWGRGGRTVMERTDLCSCPGGGGRVGLGGGPGEVKG